MKTDYTTVIFNDKCVVILDEPDGWYTVWILHGNRQPTHLNVQQCGQRVMLFTSILVRKNYT